MKFHAVTTAIAVAGVSLSAEAGFEFDELSFGNGFENSVAMSAMTQQTGTLGNPPYTYVTGPGLELNPYTMPTGAGQWYDYGTVRTNSEGTASATIDTNFYFHGGFAPPASARHGMRITFDSPVYTFGSWIQMSLAEDRLVEVFDTGGALIDSYLMQVPAFPGSHTFHFFGYESTSALGEVHITEPGRPDGVGTPTLGTGFMFSTVPAPGVGAFALLGGTIGLRRRR